MPFSIANRNFEIVHASDISTRDGLGYELWELGPSGRVLLIEIFRHDNIKQIDFATFEGIDIPFEALDVLLHHFNTSGDKEFIDYSDWQ